MNGWVDIRSGFLRSGFLIVPAASALNLFFQELAGYGQLSVSLPV
jgi:hypothetical protein